MKRDADCYVLPVKLRETFARRCLFQPTICRRSDSPCPENPDAYLQNQQPCGRQKDRTMNMKTDLRLSLYSRNPVSVNECYGNRHFFFSRPAGGTLSFLCAEGAAPQFFQGTCSIFSRPMLQAYPPVFLRGDELCDDSLIGGAFRRGPIFDAPGGVGPPLLTSLSTRQRTPRAPGARPARPGQAPRW